MLKQASDTANATKMARKRLSENRQKARLIEKEMSSNWHTFERRACHAALGGAFSLVVADFQLDFDSLVTLGFSAEELRHSPTQEEYLSKIVAESSDGMHRLINELHGERPLIQVILQNPKLENRSFVPLLDWLWREKLFTQPADVLNLSAHLKSYSGVDANWIDEKRNEFERLIGLFEKLKRANAKLQFVRHRNQLIPDGYDKATLVSWENVDDGGGLTVTFSGQKLNWLAKHWATLAADLNGLIEAASQEGRYSNSIDMTFDGRRWVFFKQDVDEVDEQYSVCSPLVLLEQLSPYGYQCEIWTITYDEECEEILTEADPNEQRLEGCERLRLGISWLSTDR